MTRDRKHADDRAGPPSERARLQAGLHAGTARVLADAGIEVETVRKVQEGRPNLLDKMANGEIQFIFNTPSGKGARTDEGRIRAAAVAYGVPCVTTIPGCLAVVKALEAYVKDPVPRVRASGLGQNGPGRRLPSRGEPRRQARRRRSSPRPAPACFERPVEHRRTGRPVALKERHNRLGRLRTHVGNRL